MAVTGTIKSVAASTLVMMTFLPLIGSDFSILNAFPSSEIKVAVMQVSKLANATIASVTLGKYELILSAVNGNSSTEVVSEFTISSNLTSIAPTAITITPSPC